MWVFDSRTRAIIGANDAAVRTYGYTRAELLACTVDDLCVVSSRQPSTPWSSLGEEGAWTGPWTQRRKDGSTFTAELGTIEMRDPMRSEAIVIVHACEEGDGGGADDGGSAGREGA